MAADVSPSASRHPVYIGVAWPYANGPLHLGHIAGSLLPPDIFRRYQRMAGRDVLMVSGSDCHGTPILLKAEGEGKTPQEVVDGFHQEHAKALGELGIHFDLFTRTTTKNHRENVQKLFLDLLEEGFIEKRTMQAPFDAKAQRFLPDRYVEGTCPHCETPGARGDQCDHCGKTLDPQDLLEPRSKLDPENPIEFRDTDHFFLLFSKLQPELEAYIERTSGHWRANTINFTNNWLKEGIQDRAITRDLTWGVPIPLDGFEDKRIYVWFEAVCGYLTAAMEWADRASRGDWDGVADGAHHTSAPTATAPEGWQDWWTDPATQAYYFLGKDNIPFHTIIWPGILIAANHARRKRGEPELVLPYDVPANEFLNLGGQQFSKSRGVSIDVLDVLGRFDADAVRYYLAVNMPEQRDADWTWDDFLSKVNDELVGAIGNLAHRILSFTQKNVGHVPAAGEAPDGLAARVDEAIRSCAADMADHLEHVRLKKGVRRLLEFAGQGNQIMQEAAPWKLLKQDRAAGEAALHELLRMVKALALFMAPYLPHAADKLWATLAEEGSIHDASWDDAGSPPRAGAELAMPKALFRKLDPKDLPQEDEKEAAAADEPTVVLDPVSFEEFQKVKLRMATVKSVEEHPKADKLYVIKLDAGDLGERQIVAGLKAYYKPEELAGQTVAFVANLAPVKLRGVESQGMILAADHGDVVTVLNPHRAVPAGAEIR